MKKIISSIIILFIFVCSVFANDGKEIIGKYKSSNGTTLEITATSFKINNSSLPLVMGQTSSDFMTGFGGLTYYIKPCFVYNDKKITITNIWLQYPGNDMLAVYIFTYDIETKKLLLTSWDIFTVSMDGANTVEFIKN